MRAVQLLESDVQKLLKTAAAALDEQMRREGDYMVRAYVRMEAGLTPSPSEDRSPENADPKNIDALIYAWCENRVAEVYYELQFLGRSGFIPAWRVITAPKTWTPDGRHPGIYWSWDREAAEAHWGENGDAEGIEFTTWEMHADIPMQDIDWLITLVMNSDPSYTEEKEIRLKKNVPVKIKSVTDLED